jgi:prepilin-type N-terminal cleavage/methylation domain-containing protein
MKSSIRNMKKQKGFTLIEIAIVLVIIGLLVGGVLQGQELIENSRVKQVVKDMNGTAAAIFTYQDRYGRLPGDDGNANGLLQINANQTFTGAGEG